jgi:hypothetical protein
MTNFKPCATFIDTQAKVSSDVGAPLSDATVYHSLTEAL